MASGRLARRLRHHFSMLMIGMINMPTTAASPHDRRLRACFTKPAFVLLSGTTVKWDVDYRRS
jgi:hypothetical protein